MIGFQNDAVSIDNFAQFTAVTPPELTPKYTPEYLFGPLTPATQARTDIAGTAGGQSPKD